MPARTIIMNPKTVMAVVLCVSFLVAAAFDERAGADGRSQESYAPTQTSVPIAE